MSDYIHLWFKSCPGDVSEAKYTNLAHRMAIAHYLLLMNKIVMLGSIATFEACFAAFIQQETMSVELQDSLRSLCPHLLLAGVNLQWTIKILKK